LSSLPASPVALVSLPWQGLLGLALLGVFVGPLLGVAIHPRTDENNALPIYLLPATIAAVVGTIAAAGLIAVSAAIALPVITLLAACSPPVLRRLARAPWTGKPRPDTVVAAPTPPPARPPQAPRPIPSCHSLSDAELGWRWRWRTSFTALQRTVSAAQRLYLVEFRSALLNELAQRNPTGIHPLAQQRGPRRQRPGRYVASIPSRRHFSQ